MVVGPQTVAMGVVIAEEPPLEHLVRRGSDPGHEVARGESSLFDLGEVVLRVAVEDHAAHRVQRCVAVGPDLSDVEGVEAVVLDLLGGHDLRVDLPARVLAALDRLVQIASGVVRVLALHALGLVPGQVLDALFGFEVDLHPEVLTLVVVPLEGVSAVAVHVSI